MPKRTTDRTTGRPDDVRRLAFDDVVKALGERVDGPILFGRPA